VVDAVLHECRARGLDPIVEHVSNARLREILGSTPAEELALWDVGRIDVARNVTGMIVLGGWLADLSGLPEARVEVWLAAVRRVELEMEQRDVPTVVVAVPTDDIARQLGLTPAELEARVIPGVLMTSTELAAGLAPLVGALESAPHVEVTTAAGTLRVERGDRPVMTDDGMVDAVDIGRGAVVSNLPAGSLYWTVLEDRTRGKVELVDGSRLRFDDEGRVVDGVWAGERVSHLGIARNTAVTGSIGWTIVDQHRPGAVFLALGENRYMGGENESPINVDLIPATPTVVAGGITLVENGILAGEVA
jgi:hypothetical protein